MTFFKRGCHLSYARPVAAAKMSSGDLICFVSSTARSERIALLMVRPGEVRGAAAAVPPSESAFTLDVGSAMFKSAASKSRGTDGEASADDTAGPADVANMKDLEEFEGWTLPSEDGADDGGPPNAVPSYAGNFTTPVWSLSSMRFRHAIRDGGERAERLFDEMLRGAEKKIADAERRAEAAESLANERQLNASLNGASDPSPSRAPPAEGPPEGKPKNANRVPNAFSRGHPGAVDHDDERSLETGSGGGSPRVRLPPLEFAPTLATQSGGSLPGEATAPLAPASGRPLSARDHERIDGGDESTDGRRMDDRTDRRAAAESSTRSSAVSAPVRSRPESPGTKRPETPGDDDDVDVVNIGGAAFGFRRPAWSLTSMAARHRRVNRGAVSRVENSTPAGDRDGDGDGDGDEKSAPGDGDGDPAALARRLAATLRTIDEAVGDHRGDARTAMRLVRDALADAKPSVDAAKRL